MYSFNLGFSTTFRYIFNVQITCLFLLDSSNTNKRALDKILETFLPGIEQNDMKILLVSLIQEISHPSKPSESSKALDDHRVNLIDAIYFVSRIEYVFFFFTYSSL